MVRIFTSGIFWFMLAHFLLLVGFLIYNLKFLFESLKNISKKTWFLLFLIFLFGFYLRNSEYWLGIHSDGYVSQEAAHYWLMHGKFVKSCALGNVDNCKLYQQVLAPPGFPFLIALVSLFVGFHSLSASVISAILSSLTIILVFLIAYKIFQNRTIGLAAAMVFSLIPLNILESQSGASRPSGLFFVGLAILFYIIAISNKFQLSLWLLVALSVSYSIYIRQESYVLIPFLLIFIFLFKEKSLINLLKKSKQCLISKDLSAFFQSCLEKKAIAKSLIIIIIFFIAQIPILSWLLFHNPFNSYNAPGVFSLHYKNIGIQAPAIISQLFNFNNGDGFINHYNFFVSSLFLFGFVSVFFSKSIKSVFIAGLFLVYFFLYSSMSHINLFLPENRLTYDFMRRSLMYDLPYSIIAAYPLGFIAKKKVWVFFLGAVILITMPIPILALFKNQALFKDSRVNKIFDLSFEDRNEEYFLATSKTPYDCLIITQKYMIVTNDYFKNNHREAVDVELIHPDREELFLEYLRQKINSGKEVLYFDDNRCQGTYDFPCEFLSKYFKKRFIFSQGSISVYSLDYIYDVR